ncbi:MAG: DMT family transporter [Granulosicoccus sp.]|nr:DMT family transporter [Granulosicoccus sp.]
MSWILLTFFAALMQSVRTAGQKSLSVTVSPMAATMVRYVFGLPFGIVYLCVVVNLIPDQAVNSLVFSKRFFSYAVAAAALQILATALLIEVFRTRNFAVGTSYAKTEAIMTAILGVLLFAEHLSFLAWISIVIGVVGLIAISLSSANVGELIHKGNQAALLGIGSGFCFALTSLFLREASLSLGGHAYLTAAVTLVFMVSLQSVLCLLWLWLRDAGQFAKLRPLLPICLFVGLTSVAGSVGWFTAMTLQNAAYVKALGQVEFLFTLLITGRIFRETISPIEGGGMFLIIASVCLLFLATSSS